MTEAEDKKKKKQLLNTGHRKRLLGRFLQSGGTGFYDYELLELLLCYAIPRKDVKNIAKELLLRFGSISGVLNAENFELTMLDNVGENTVGLLKLVKKLNEEIHFRKMENSDVLSNPIEVADFVRMKIGGGRKETLMMIFLNSRNGVIAYECYSGTVDRTTVYNRELAEKALAHRASCVIIAHNHPSGFCDPSAEDVRFSCSLQRALNSLGIKLYDHLIVSGNNFYSMRAAKKIPNDVLDD